MRLLTAKGWIDGFLDEHRDGEECRIHVDGLINLEALTGLYFVRPRSIRLVWNYFREIGAAEVWRKIRSRRSETIRNMKYISAGFGRVCEVGGSGKFSVGQAVAFVATCHPACFERIVLPEIFLRALGPEERPRTSEDEILYASDPAGDGNTRWWADVLGWNRFSGAGVSDGISLMNAAVAAVSMQDWNRARVLPRTVNSVVGEVRLSRQRDAKVPSATLIGYGNYAKTVILPNVSRHLSVHRIHEVDPTQIPIGEESVTWDTAPTTREEDDAAVVLIAGFHHTHAPLAIEALGRGQYAVAEKPLAVDRDQAEALIDAVSANPRFFACFHKRYLPFNRYVRADLGVELGDPISYHCLVYEVPLPENHWYHWPNSKSRLVSNGCHWLDHFLFLNAYSDVVSAGLHALPHGAANCSVELKNGASFSMVLTDEGSRRIGVQDYVELRSSNATVRMINGSTYEAEASDRIVRRMRINRMVSYHNMYRMIGARIERGDQGDSVDSVRSSTLLVLSLEAKLQEMLPLGLRSGATRLPRTMDATTHE